MTEPSHITPEAVVALQRTIDSVKASADVMRMVHGAITECIDRRDLDGLRRTADNALALGTAVHDGLQAVADFLEKGYA